MGINLITGIAVRVCSISIIGQRPIDPGMGLDALAIA